MNKRQKKKRYKKIHGYNQQKDWEAAVNGAYRAEPGADSDNNHTPGREEKKKMRKVKTMAQVDVTILKTTRKYLILERNRHDNVLVLCATAPSKERAEAYVRAAVAGRKGITKDDYAIFECNVPKERRGIDLSGPALKKTPKTWERRS